MVGLQEVIGRRGRLFPAIAPLVTLPIALIAVLKFSEFGVHLFKARDGSSTWYFRFSRNAMLQVRDDGDWCWRQGSKRWRREVAPFLARAEALTAVNHPSPCAERGFRCDAQPAMRGGIAPTTDTAVGLGSPAKSQTSA